MRIIAGTLRGRKYTPPTQPGLRPITDSLRETLFNMLNHRMLINGARVFDLFSGGGSMAYECASRGAAEILSVEQNPVNTKFIDATAEEFGIDNIQTLTMSVEHFVAQSPEPADLILCDPPYRLMTKGQLLQSIFDAGLLREGGWLAIHHPRHEQFEQLPHYIEERAHGQAKLTFFNFV